MYDFFIKNVYINKLSEIVGKYKNTIYESIKMKHVHVKLNKYFDFPSASNTKSLQIRLIIRCKYESVKVCFQKITYQIRHNKCF